MNLQSNRPLFPNLLLSNVDKPCEKCILGFLFLAERRGTWCGLQLLCSPSRSSFDVHSRLELLVPSIAQWIRIRMAFIPKFVHKLGIFFGVMVQKKGSTNRIQYRLYVLYDLYYMIIYYILYCIINTHNINIYKVPTDIRIHLVCR